MSNVETVITVLEGLFEGQTYTEEERSRLGAFVMNKLEVPGTIWSLEDFEAEADEELTAEERDKVCREAYNAKSNDLSENDWDNIRATLEEPTNRVLSKRDLEIGALYYYDRFDHVLVKSNRDISSETVEESSELLAEWPTGDDIAKNVGKLPISTTLYYKLTFSNELDGGGYNLYTYAV